MKYATIVYSPNDYAHKGAFAEVAQTVEHGLSALGKLGTLSDAERIIVFGVNLLPHDWHAVDRDRAILYNLEQLGSPWLDESRLAILRRHEVWDYSASNVAWLKERGIAAKHVPIGYAAEMERITPAVTKSIDVLFYGSMNERRQKIYDGLCARGLDAHHVFGVYGKDRDNLIAKSKVVLNVHYYEAKIFEVVRCSYLFNNRVCVVSEESEDVPAGLVGEIPLEPYGGLVETCAALCNIGGAPHLAERGYEAFKKCPEAEYLAKAIS